MSKSKNLQASIDFTTNKKRKVFNRKTGAILGGVVVTALAGSYLTIAKLPAKEQIFEKILKLFCKNIMMLVLKMFKLCR